MDFKNIDFKKVVDDILKKGLSDEQIKGFKNNWEKINESSKKKGEGLHEKIEDFMKSTQPLQDKLKETLSKTFTTEKNDDSNDSFLNTLKTELEKIYDLSNDEPTGEFKKEYVDDVEKEIKDNVDYVHVPEKVIITAKEIFDATDEFKDKLRKLHLNKTEFYLDLDSIVSDDYYSFELLTKLKTMMKDIENESANVSEEKTSNELFCEKMKKFDIQPESCPGKNDEIYGGYTDYYQEYLDKQKVRREPFKPNNKKIVINNKKIERPDFLSNQKLYANIFKIDDYTNIIGIPLLGYDKSELVTSTIKTMDDQNITFKIVYPNKCTITFTAYRNTSQDISKTIEFGGMLYLTFVQNNSTKITL